jgi:ketosteroid isomerase-like protein
MIHLERGGTMSEQANVRLIRELYDAFSRGDLAAVLSSIDTQAELVFEGPQSIPWAGNWRGREGWARFFQTLGETTDEITVSMEPFAAQCDHVAAVGRYRARVKRTGRRIDSPLVHLWTVRDGQVVRCQELTDTAAEAAACTLP